MLLNSGADPAPKDLYSQTPYLIASKNMRTFLRKFAGQNPDMHDWQSFGINPITSDKEIEMKKKIVDKHKRKKQNQKKRNQEKQQEEIRLTEQKRIEAEKAEKERQLAQTESSRTAKISNLTEREKRALAAEARLKATERKGDTCSFCFKSITTIPYERLQYKYCSIECVGKHMDTL